MISSPLFSFLVLSAPTSDGSGTGQSEWEDRAWLEKQKRLFGTTGGATSYQPAGCSGPQVELLLINQPAPTPHPFPPPPPPPRKEAEGPACEDRGQEIWTESQIPVPACVIQSGLRGHPTKASFQGWCHFHQEPTVAPQ